MNNFKTGEDSQNFRLELVATEVRDGSNYPSAIAVHYFTQPIIC